MKMTVAFTDVYKGAENVRVETSTFPPPKLVTTICATGPTITCFR